MKNTEQELENIKQILNVQNDINENLMAMCKHHREMLELLHKWTESLDRRITALEEKVDELVCRSEHNGHDATEETVSE